MPDRRLSKLQTMRGKRLVQGRCNGEVVYGARPTVRAPLAALIPLLHRAPSEGKGKPPLYFHKLLMMADMMKIRKRVDPVIDRKSRVRQEEERPLRSSSSEILAKKRR